MKASKISLLTYLLVETPIGDYQTFGDWTKNSSFRDKRDRMLIKNPSSIERMRKKFANNSYNFNLYFVNSSKANKHTEVGFVDLNFVRKELGDDVANAIENGPNADDSINVVFTNNKGSERMPFTAWIAAHRMGHAFARKNGNRGSYSSYMHASNHLINQLSGIMQNYGMYNFPDSENKINRYENRDKQLAMIHFFQNIATFKSARDHNLRDWFEVLNELIAQYLTTGKIKFNNAPKMFGGKNKFYLKDEESANEQIQMLARDMEFMIDDILSSAVGSTMVM